MDDICRTVLEVLERVNLCKYVDFSNRNSHEYDTFMISNLAILFKVFFNYISTRDIEKLCYTDI